MVVVMCFDGRGIEDGGETVRELNSNMSLLSTIKPTTATMDAAAICLLFHLLLVHRRQRRQK